MTEVEYPHGSYKGPMTAHQDIINWSHFECDKFWVVYPYYHKVFSLVKDRFPEGLASFWFDGRTGRFCFKNYWDAYAYWLKVKDLQDGCT